VRLLVATMFEVNKETYTKQRVSLQEFVLFISGILNFDKFPEYTRADINHCYMYLKKDYHAQYTFLAKFEVIKCKKLVHHKIRENEDMNEHLDSVNSARKNSVSSELIQTLNLLTENDKTLILKFYEKLTIFQDKKFNNFPPVYFKYKSLIDPLQDAYLMSDLIDWFNNKNALKKDSGLPLTDWAKEFLLPTVKEKKESSKQLLQDDYIKISTLPKMIQLQIDAHLDEETKYNSEKSQAMGSSRYEEKVGALLDKKAKLLGIKLATEKDAFGLGKINYQKVMMFLRPND
jgi:hypothetical protein